MNIAVILAGGTGIRLEKSLPKQFFKVAGKMVIEHTVDAFERNELVDEIAIVINNHYLFMIEDMIIKNEWKKVKRVLIGGKERYHSSLAAVNAYADLEDANLIFHDAARPLVSQRIISEVVGAMDNYKAVDVAIHSADTIIEVQNQIITAIPERVKMRRGQTPQGFKQAVIAKAYELAMKDKNFKATDDCGVVKKYLPEESIFVVDGEEVNMKLTYPEDTYLLDKLFQLRSVEIQNIELSLESLADKVMVVFGGTYGIGKSIVDLGKQNGIRVYNFSRSENNVDVSNMEAVKEVLEKVFQTEHKIDYIVNTAGILYKEPLETMNYQNILNSVNVNYLGMVNIALASLPYLKQSKGHILFFTSSSYTRGRAFYSIYSSGKAAIVNFVQAISQEWETLGIKVNCMNPERTETPMRIKNFGSELQNTLLKPETVALRCIQTLLSNYTGQVIDVRL
ncbi:MULTISPECIES: bifunctional cytidylyltransferase/SDR family oxidoreductase [Flavobacterium]|uniref:Bifunctional cytidylyltransferase/SDR family oxidoreductase n=1 Tax=Flavobacterium lipolyticum TaxID=2893754 RepID=A0ABS8M4F9_9FLAO|nr:MULTISPECIES: bifunctional cytidylyltransferase/SDR family oxidoreductase [unclassified Flavobacterium]MCC9019086.1 bifunctional cytidylyltransferase/SDR family oxidoreductase [Flavobacterium sp. F-126]